ncbi:hypothetical protein HID58_050093 [Brassica napus]|uniref:Uncharacterized protein n=1 Tax=Brassica napus TaxID=3708 RepID=A0ABQ8A587_BRANA|nr:hypothetical protein HID58_050093 [Brassica napus]
MRILETLTLGYRGRVHSHDLSKSSPTLTTLKITRRLSWTPGSLEIVGTLETLVVVFKHVRCYDDPT